MSQTVIATTETPAEFGKRYGMGAQKVRQLIECGVIDAIDVSVGEKRPRWRITEEARIKFEYSRSASRNRSPQTPTPRRRRKSSSVKDFNLG